MSEHQEKYAEKANEAEFIEMIKGINDFLRENPDRMSELSAKVELLSDDEDICTLLGIEPGNVPNIDTIKLGYYAVLYMKEDKEYPSLPMH